MAPVVQKFVRSWHEIEYACHSGRKVRSVLFHLPLVTLAVALIANPNESIADQNSTKASTNTVGHPDPILPNKAWNEQSWKADSQIASNPEPLKCVAFPGLCANHLKNNQQEISGSYDPLSFAELLLSPDTRAYSSGEPSICLRCGRPSRFVSARLFSGLSVFAPEFPSQDVSLDDPNYSQAPDTGKSDNTNPIFKAALQSPSPGVPPPWQFEGNGAQGVKTWLSASHILEINPDWLDFGMFDSMDLNMTDQPPGLGQSEPQPWRSAFTVGLATDWQLTRSFALHAGYRFYDNPMPDDISSGAYPNATQHVMAMAMSVREGPHSLALTYGLDLLVAANSTGISSARQGDNINPVAHLASLNYNYSF